MDSTANAAAQTPEDQRTRSGRLRDRVRALLFFGIPISLAVIAANHVEYRFRLAGAQARSSEPVAVRSEGDFLAGHNTIGIDENAASGDDLLRFSLLAQWDYDSQSASACPQEIEASNGRCVTCIGFMYPLEVASELKSFCLLRTTQTCCFGPRPQLNQYLLVELARPVRFERLAPVIVRGKFFVDPQPDQGFIYRMEGETVDFVAGDEPDPDPVDAARKAGLPLFDFSLLAAAKDRREDGPPAGLAALDGKRVVVSGFFADRGQNPPRLLVAGSYWDGISQGERPTIYNAVMVYLRDASQVPPLWKQKGMLTGVLRIERSRDAWSSGGIAGLYSAVLGAGKGSASDPGIKPMLSSWVEAAVVALILVAAFLQADVCRRLNSFLLRRER